MASVANGFDIESAALNGLPGEAVPSTGPVGIADAERRRAARMACYVGATVRTIDVDPRRGDAILSYAVDLSETGALIRTLRTLPAGTRVELALTPRLGARDARVITTRGEIVRTTTPRGRGETHDLGVRFDNPLALATLLSSSQ